MAIVDFIVMGSMKSGSTTLSDYLNLNDDISMSFPKEPQYFSRHYNKDIKNYDNMWFDKEKKCGESSTCYSRWPFYDGVPARIAAYNPKMKLIYIMRHPVERAYSHYIHNVLTDGYGYSSFTDALDASDEIIMTSMYMTQIRQYLKYFPKEQLLILDFDDLKTQPALVINQIEDFLEVKRTHVVKTRANEAGSAAAKGDLRNTLDKIRRLPIISHIVETLFSDASRHLIRQKISVYIGRSIITKMITKLKLRKVKPLTPLEREKILERVLPDIEQLEDYWGKNLNKWKF